MAEKRDKNNEPVTSKSIKGEKRSERPSKEVHLNPQILGRGPLIKLARSLLEKSWKNGGAISDSGEGGTETI